MAVFTDFAKRQHLRVGLRQVDEGAFQFTVAAGPDQAGVDALSRNMSLGISLRYRRCTSVWPVVCISSDSSRPCLTTITLAGGQDS